LWIDRRHDKEDLLIIDIRREERTDRDAVYRLNVAAFHDRSEAKIVEQLRDSCADYLAFVAVHDDMVVGHILFTPARVDGCTVAGMGLAPMAVHPSHQRRGIGSELVRHGLEHLRQAGCPFVMVLGHPEYYPRFGFEPASKYCLLSQWEGIPDEAFMVVVFDDAVLPKAGGIARYRDEFDAAM
jgi:putative acetyltransferase